MSLLDDVMDEAKNLAENAGSQASKQSKKAADSPAEQVISKFTGGKKIDLKATAEEVKKFTPDSVDKLIDQAEGLLG